MKNLKLTSSIAAILMSGAVSAPVLADEDVVLEEIIVTAQKREQRLQDVPVSISVLNGERMTNLLAGGADIRALAGRVPGLNAESSNGRVAPRFYLRGLGNTDFDLAASQPVSVIMDDVVLENVALKSFPLFDVERVEVLRGPQGTLFGKNTPAGIVKFDTRGPSQEASGYTNVNFGNLGTIELEAAYGAPIDENSSYRAAALYQRRGDWIDNGFTGEDDAMGGFEEVAGRIKYLLEEDNVSFLFNVHGRSLKGTSSIFRANILGGSNELNNNFDRKTVWFDEGENNPQEYNSFGASAKITVDLDSSTLTSITSYDNASGYSLGDIDGGYGAVYLPEMGPGFIPFNSATKDEMDSTSQFTQEIRLASNSDTDVNWQVGAYYFTSDLSVTTFPFFVPESNVQHSNTSWSVFGQTAFNLSEATTLTLGSRFTTDSKTLVGTAGWAPVTFNEEVYDDRFSWDIAVNHEVSNNFSVYGRLASGFRAPTIQGRDIAFFGAPSVAKSETILSGELGFKSNLLDNTLRLNGAVYNWDMKNQQISAVGGAGNFVQLINAPHTSGYGAEFDLEWVASKNLYVTAGFALTETNIDRSMLVGTCSQCTILDPTRGGQRGTAVFAQVKNNALPQAPDWSLNLTARYSVELDAGEFYIFTDWFVEGEKSLFIYDSVEYRTNGDFEGNLRAGFTWNDGMYDLSFYMKNITNEANVKGGIDFNNNTGFVNDARTFGLSLRANF